jgi:class 3 adenylate cyclase
VLLLLILQVIMDEKGLVLLYAFGMPGYSYENNNLHAVRVALEIKDTARRDFRHRVGVGVASGQICCGLIGKGDFRCVCLNIII